MDNYKNEYVQAAGSAPQDAVPQTEQETVYTYNKVSPFADSPYDTPFNTVTATPSRKKKKAKTGKGKRVLLGFLVVVLLIGSCAGTGYLVNDYHQQNYLRMQAAMNDRIDVLQEQLHASKNPPAANGSVQATPSGALTPAQVYEKTHLAVVEVVSEATTIINGQEAQFGSTGTGFIISEDGYIVSNYHVIEGGETITINTGFKKTYTAEVIGFDAENDFSLLKIDDKELPYVDIGSSDSMAIGDQVVAIGYPLSSGSTTLTVGYISAKDRVITTEGRTINMLQTDAAINSGNSGGPLLNMQGEVVGITTAKSSGTSSTGAAIEGVGYAIPADDIFGMISDLKEFGYITGAYLGVWVRDVELAAQSYGLPAGAYVEDVMEGYAAQRAGIKSQDIIINIDGYDVTNLTDLTLALRKMKAGETVSVTVYRNGSEVYLSITLDEKPQEQPVQKPTVPEIPDSSDSSENIPEQDFFQDWYDFFAPFFKDWAD